ncbi:MAG: hypothetical protein V2J51_12300 [Erythrobacter sp.]|jgi:hypothetical protein|nr:hypothetical protein [Erythrobacter sp.]
MTEVVSALAAVSVSMTGAGGASHRTIALGASGGTVPGGQDAAQPQAVAQARFDAAMQDAGLVSSVAQGGEVPRVMGGLFDTLDSVDQQARSVADYARSAASSDGQLTPGEIVNLTMRCQEFMFQCQLTSNIANRSADGVQQLFRQQG